MANVDIGFLGFGTGQNRIGKLQRPGFAPDQAGIRTDTYAFETGSITANVAISSLASFGSSGSDIALVLFKDNNADKVLNAGDTVVPGGNAGSGGRFQAVNTNLTKGDYIARLTSAFDTGYNVRFARGTTGGANPLAAPEFQLGTIAQDLRKRDTISDKDTADNFAFTLDGSSSLNIGVRELGNKKGDVNIRIVQDLNSNGFVDKNEVVVKGTSTPKGNLDSISGLNKAGDYILQVCQTQGNSQFAVKFDHSAA